MKIRLRSENTRRMSLTPIVAVPRESTGIKKARYFEKKTRGPMKVIYANASAVKQSSTTPVKKLYAEYFIRKPNKPASAAEKAGVRLGILLSFMKKT
jgi:hypothetical protein